MNLEALSQLGKIAGIAGICVGAMVIIFSGLLKNTVFKGMSQQHSYRIVRLIVMFAGIMAIAGLGSWVYLDILKNQTQQTASLNTRYITGKVISDQQQPVSLANVKVEQDPSFFDKSDQGGQFALELRGKGKRYFDLILTHGNYSSARQKVWVDFEEGEEKVKLSEPLLMKTKTVEIIESTSNDGEEVAVGTSAGQESKRVSITLNYTGDLIGCVLDLSVKIGSKSFNPIGNSVSLSDLKPGQQNYSISGLISCGYAGSCQATGSGSINVISGGQYYIVWNANYYNCQVQVLNQQAYQNLIMQ